MDLPEGTLEGENEEDITRVRLSLVWIDGATEQRMDVVKERQRREVGNPGHSH